jgi:hypothetical protein
MLESAYTVNELIDVVTSSAIFFKNGGFSNAFVRVIEICDGSALEVSFSRRSESGELCSAGFRKGHLAHLLDVQSIRKASSRAQMVSFVGYVMVKARESFARWAINNKTSQPTQIANMSLTGHECAAPR